MKKLTAKDVAFYGRPIDALSKKELLEALLTLANMVHQQQHTDNPPRVNPAPPKDTPVGH